MSVLALNINNNPQQPIQVPEEITKGKYLVQTGTNRVYPYTDRLAGRDDMMLFDNGIQINNPLHGRNKSRPSEESAAKAVQNIDNGRLTHLERENQDLKDKMDSLLASFNQIQNSSVLNLEVPQIT